MKKVLKTASFLLLVVFCVIFALNYYYNSPDSPRNRSQADSMMRDFAKSDSAKIINQAFAAPYTIQYLPQSRPPMPPYIILKASGRGYNMRFRVLAISDEHCKWSDIKTIIIVKDANGEKISKYYSSLAGNYLYKYDASLKYYDIASQSFVREEILKNADKLPDSFTGDMTIPNARIISAVEARFPAT